MRRAASTDKFQIPKLHTLPRVPTLGILNPALFSASRAPLTVLTPPQLQRMHSAGKLEGLSLESMSSPTVPLLPAHDQGYKLAADSGGRGMACFGCRCGFSLVGVQKWRLTRTFQRCGLIERQVQIDDQTSIHCWVSKPFADAKHRKPVPARRNSLLLLHGFGASAIFQWAGQINAFHKQFDLIIPDLIFFGGSVSSSEERSELFEAASMASLMHDVFKVDRYHVAGISYGGFVAYRMAYTYPERVQRVVLTDSPGVVMVRSDYEKMLSTHGVASTADLLLPETPADVRRLLQVAYYRPPRVPNFLLRDTLQVMFSDMVEEKRGMLVKLLEYLDNPEVPLPKLTQDVLIVWGEQDEIFPLALAKRLHEFLGKKARLVVLKHARHASNIEKPKEYNRAVLDFLLQEGT